jgi:hypothetical protein
LAPQNDREATLLQTLQPGNYTAVVRGKDDAPAGVALVEIYNVQ